MYTSSMKRCYTLHRVLRPFQSDTYHNVNLTIFACAPGTASDIYASNIDNSLSTPLFPDWRLSKDSPMLEGLAWSSNTLT